MHFAHVCVYVDIDLGKPFAGKVWLKGFRFNLSHTRTLQLFIKVVHILFFNRCPQNNAIIVNQITKLVFFLSLLAHASSFIMTYI